MSVQIDLRRSFGAFDLAVRFEAPERGVTALFGPSGAGKTAVVHELGALGIGVLLIDDKNELGSGAAAIRTRSLRAPALPDNRQR